ncbi:MAG: 50S ribosomal protein L1, partial [Bacteroidetes bacterium]|nr:50S ribosomal protein L1 [Bacteroidota bacterium]
MARLTKNQKAALSKIEVNKAYSLQDASTLVKDITTTKF